MIRFTVAGRDLSSQIKTHFSKSLSARMFLESDTSKPWYVPTESTNKRRCAYLTIFDPSQTRWYSWCNKRMKKNSPPMTKTPSLELRALTPINSVRRIAETQTRYCLFCSCVCRGVGPSHCRTPNEWSDRKKLKKERSVQHVLCCMFYIRSKYSIANSTQIPSFRVYSGHNSSLAIQRQLARDDAWRPDTKRSLHPGKHYTDSESAKPIKPASVCACVCVWYVNKIWHTPHKPSWNTHSISRAVFTTYLITFVDIHISKLQQLMDSPRMTVYGANHERCATSLQKHWHNTNQ